MLNIPRRCVTVRKEGFLSGSMKDDDRYRGEPLRDFILSRIREGEPVPFSRFMEWCLYHPDYGYYNSDRTRIGKEGDYYTAPSVHPMFGRLIAKQLAQMSGILGTDTFTVVEMGAGRGFLCLDILGWAREKSPEFYGRLHYRLLDASRSHRKEQAERLAFYEREGKVSWGDEGELENGESRYDGCFLSNELVDAFPVHRVVVCGGKLREIYVGEGGGGFTELVGEPSRPEIAEYFARFGVVLEEGQHAEINLRACRWIGTVGRCLRRGFVVTIDYGDIARELYASRRRNGTLMCYFRHQASENPYERIGGQDMTSHVNFSALIREGEAAGLAFTGLVPQYRFLIAMGLLAKMEEAAGGMSELEGLKMRLSLKHLIEPGAGMGESFKVLIQHKGVEKPLLDGMRDLRSISVP